MLTSKTYLRCVEGALEEKEKWDAKGALERVTQASQHLMEIGKEHNIEKANHIPPFLILTRSSFTSFPAIATKGPIGCVLGRFIVIVTALLSVYHGGLRTVCLEALTFNVPSFLT